jgi:hypothetical protein
VDVNSDLDVKVDAKVDAKAVADQGVKMDAELDAEAVADQGVRKSAPRVTPGGRAYQKSSRRTYQMARTMPISISVTRL